MGGCPVLFFLQLSSSNILAHNPESIEKSVRYFTARYGSYHLNFHYSNLRHICGIQEL